VTQIQTAPPTWAGSRVDPVWPYWPTRLSTYVLAEEGVNRELVDRHPREFVGANGKVKALKTVRSRMEGREDERSERSESTLPRT